MESVGGEVEDGTMMMMKRRMITIDGWRISLTTCSAKSDLSVDVEWISDVDGREEEAPAVHVKKLFFSKPSSLTEGSAGKRKLEHDSDHDSPALSRPCKARRLDQQDDPVDDEDRSGWCDLHQTDHASLIHERFHEPVICESRSQREARRKLCFDRLPTEVQFEVFLRLPLIEVMYTLPLVCTQWKELAYDETLWHALHVQHFCGPKIKQSNNWRKECALIMRQQHRRKQFYQSQLDEERKLHKYKELMWAIKRGYLQIVQQVLTPSCGIELNVFSERLGTPLAGAARNGHLHIIKYLLSQGAAVDSLDRAGRSALTHAIICNESKEDAAVVKLLIDEGANVNLVTKEHCTPLMYAAGKGLAEICKILLEAGAATNVQDRDGYYPLMYAVSGEHAAATRILLEHGADANAASERGWTCLMHAAGTGNVEIFDLLVKHGAKVDATFQDGRTPLYFAVGHAHTSIVKRLIDAGAKVNHRDEEGWTPLHAAMETASVPLIELLLAHGADPRQQNDDEDDALTLAPNEEIATLVRRSLDQTLPPAASDQSSTPAASADSSLQSTLSGENDGSDDEDDPDYVP